MTLLIWPAKIQLFDSRESFVVRDRDRFEFLSVGKMKQKYYRPDEEPPPLRLSPENVPAPLRSLIPLAERWGISDDTLRIEAVRKAACEAIDELRRAVAQFDDELGRLARWT